MTEAQAQAKKTFTLWYALVAVIFAQIVLLAVMFVGTSVRAHHIAQEQNARVLCPLALLLTAIYADPHTPPPANDADRQLRLVMTQMATALDCKATT